MCLYQASGTQLSDRRPRPEGIYTPRAYVGNEAIHMAVYGMTGERGGIEVGFTYVRSCVGDKVWENVRVWFDGYRIKVIGRVLGGVVT